MIFESLFAEVNICLQVYIVVMFEYECLIYVASYSHVSDRSVI